MERWGIITAWIFLIMTAISLSLFAIESEYIAIINFLENVLYTLFYTSFIMYYEYAKNTPNPTYMFGVLLYTVGYGYFTHLYFQIWKDFLLQNRIGQVQYYSVWEVYF
eukprot:UN26974